MFVSLYRVKIDFTISYNDISCGLKVNKLPVSGQWNTVTRDENRDIIIYIKDVCRHEKNND